MRDRLYNVARNFCDDYDFYIAVVSFATHDDDRQAAIDFMQQKDRPSKSEVLLFVTELHQRRHPEDYIWEE